MSMTAKQRAEAIFKQWWDGPTGKGRTCAVDPNLMLLKDAFAAGMEEHAKELQAENARLRGELEAAKGRGEKSFRQTKA